MPVTHVGGIDGRFIASADSASGRTRAPERAKLEELRLPPVQPDRAEQVEQLEPVSLAVETIGGFKMKIKSLVTTLLLSLAVSPSIAADLTSELLAMEKISWKAWGDHDVKTFSDGMTDDAVQVYPDGSVYKGREKILSDVGSHKCNLKSVEFSDANVRQPTSDTAILTYIATQDLACEGEKPFSKLTATAFYVRQGGKWRWSHYQETPVE